MVFVRGRPPETTIWQHFRSAYDGFVFGTAGEICEARLHTNADRAVELFVALAERLSPAVSVTLDDWRSGGHWTGHVLSNSDVRDAVSRIRGTLMLHAGIEISIISSDEQLTLTPNLALYIYARSDRWLYLLQGMGLRRIDRLRPRSWILGRGQFAPSPEADEALRLTVERLGLKATDRKDEGRASE
ncbi:MAG: hypothetical protein ACT4OZ_00585 [Gemmatimonadota bacterium]